MSVLSACQDAIARLVATKPNAVFASDVEICVEIASLSNEAAADIAKGHDWQALAALKTINGDGTTEGWPLPDDYDRMVNGTDVHSETWIWQRYTNTGLDGWLELKSLLPAIPPGYWNILGGSMNFVPVIATGDKAEFYYVSSKWARAAGGTPKSAFDRDDDSFALDERLLTLALIWRWKSMKGMDYQEDIRNYDIALSQAMARDGGSRVMRSSGRRAFNTRVGWPWELG